MSISLASVGLFAALLASLMPMLFVALGKLPVKALAFYGALVSVLIVHNSGLLHRRDIPKISPGMNASQASKQQCDDILKLLQEAGVIMDRSTPPRLRVDQKRWKQLPEAARKISLDCVSKAWPDDVGPPQVT